METLQQILDYAAIAPWLIAAALFCEYCWRRSSPAAALVSAETPAPAAPVTEPVAIAEDAADIADLLAISATPKPTEVLESTLPILGKLYSVPGSSKWGKSRRLRQAERHAVLQAISA